MEEKIVHENSERIRFRQKRTRRALQWVIIILGWNGGNNNSWKCEENQTQTKNKETPKPLLKLSESFTCLMCLIPFSNFLAKIPLAFSFTTLPPKNRHKFFCMFLEYVNNLGNTSSKQDSWPLSLPQSFTSSPVLKENNKSHNLAHYASG